MVLTKKQSLSVFFAVAAIIYLCLVLVSRFNALTAHSTLVDFGVLCDLVITAPGVFYFLLVRRDHSLWNPLVLTVFTGARAAVYLAPSVALKISPALHWLSIPVELFILGSIVQRLRGLDKNEDMRSRLEGISRAVVRYRWVSDLIAAEIETIYFALFSWGEKREEKQGWQSISMGEASGYTMFLSFVGVALAFEAIPTHVLLRHWSPRIASICTGLTLYGLVWVVSALRSLHLRPTLIGSERLVLRLGLLWKLEIPSDQIDTCLRVVSSMPSSKRRPGSLWLVKFNEPQWRITLRNPVRARGPYGLRRKVTEIEFAVDDSQAFAQAIGFLLHSRSTGE